MHFSGSKAAISYTENDLSEADQSLFKALLYFEIFNHPLTKAELWKYSSYTCKKELEGRLEVWVQLGYILKEGKYYLVNAVPNKVRNREAGEERVTNMWEKACKRAKLIQKFPFIRAVFISGSMSKGVVAEDGDVDFFIVTKPGKLWLSRTLLAAYKKLFLLGSYKYFCINYFIDSESLEIEERNQYTATELITLMPMTGCPLLVEEFFDRNKWIDAFYPNFEAKPVLFEAENSSGIKRLSEIIFSNKIGSLLDDFCQKLTTSFWKMKFNKMSLEDFKVALKSSKHVSKHHPLYFQKKVLTALAKNISEFENANGMKLS